MVIKLGIEVGLIEAVGELPVLLALVTCYKAHRATQARCTGDQHHEAYARVFGAGRAGAQLAAARAN